MSESGATVNTNSSFIAGNNNASDPTATATGSGTSNISKVSLGSSRAIIGAIPGYNSNIDPNGYYARKLLSNINRVTLTPTGYSLNLSGAISFAGSVDNKDRGGELFAIGHNVSTSMNLSGVSSTGTEVAGKSIGTQTALAIWESILTGAKSASSGFADNDKVDPKIQGLEILCTNDSTFTEVFSNNYKPSWLDSNGQIQSFLGKFESLKTINSMMSSFDADAGRAIMRATSTENDILNILSGKALGFQTTLPKEWANSDYNSGLQLMIRLISPSGHWKDINSYIIKPMMYLISAASPVTYNGISYGHPMLWKIRAEGMQNIDLGAISTMTISRGGTDTIFNQWNQPLNVDIRLSFESIISGFAVGVKNSGNFYDGDNDDHKKSIITSPKDIVDSFTYLNSNGKTAKDIFVQL